MEYEAKILGKTTLIPFNPEVHSALNFFFMPSPEVKPD